MKYATWKFNFFDPKYGTGPEEAIVEQGFTAEGAYIFGDEAKEATILGYFTGEPTDLETWQFAEATQTEALYMVQQIYANALVMNDGRISPGVEPEISA